MDLDLAKERLSISRQVSVGDHNRRNERRLQEPYSVEDWVLIRDSSLDVTYQTKEPDRWFGPYIVAERTRGRAYRIRELDGAIKTELISHTRLRPYYRPDHLLDQQHSADEMIEEEFEDHRRGNIDERREEEDTSIREQGEEDLQEEIERLYGRAKELDEPLPPATYIPTNKVPIRI